MKNEETLLQLVERSLKTMRGFTESNSQLLPQAVLAFLDNVERLIKEQQDEIHHLKVKANGWDLIDDFITDSSCNPLHSLYKEAQDKARADGNVGKPGIFMQFIENAAAKIEDMQEEKTAVGNFELPQCDSSSTATTATAQHVTIDQLLTLLGRWQSIGKMLVKTDTTNLHRHILADTNSVMEAYTSGRIVSNDCDKFSSEASKCAATKNTVTLEEIIESAKNSEQGDAFQAAFDRASNSMEIGRRVRKLKHAFPHLHAAVMSILEHHTDSIGDGEINDICVGWTNIGTVKNMVAANLESDDVETRETAQVVNGLLQVIYNLSSK